MGWTMGARTHYETGGYFAFTFACAGSPDVFCAIYHGTSCAEIQKGARYRSYVARLSEKFGAVQTETLAGSCPFDLGDLDRLHAKLEKQTARGNPKFVLPEPVEDIF